MWGSRLIRAGAVRGFTLTELVVVVILLGILASLAIPRFGRTTNKAMELEASLALEKVYQMQNIYFLQHRVVCDNLVDLGLVELGTLASEPNEERRYKITLEKLSDETYIAKAVPTVAQLKAFAMDQSGRIRELP